MDAKTPERIALEARAKEFGVEFGHNIGDEKLTERVEAAEVKAAEAAAAKNNLPVEGAHVATDDGSQSQQAGAADAPVDQNTPQSPVTSGGGVGGEGGPTNPPSPEASGLVARVTGPKRGRRRIGRSFGPEPVDIPLDELSDAEAKALGEDPALTVELLHQPEG